MNRGDKVRRVHPSYPGSLIEQGKLYTVRDFNEIHLTLEEMDWDHLFLIDAFKVVNSDSGCSM